MLEFKNILIKNILSIDIYFLKTFTSLTLYVERSCGFW